MGSPILRTVLRTTLPLLVVLVPTLAAAQGWQSDGQGTSTWSVAPSEGQCNVSQAKNLARRAGIIRTDVVYQDNDTLTLRGLTEWGERRDIIFANVRGCPEIGFQDVLPLNQRQTQPPPVQRR
ncbi:hypothetical protein QTL95_05945 [Rhizobium sp. S152]|uniref:hypothetical protein n=1 Tax=Rhizobium sp. S152 TaxID=3055038 RepID=UPI0025A9758F|nr:hypothetical protein [Rhizobium sp. S152]MDM9625427.1 hypothetical protein [Rhizobium sp. S152]